MIRKRRGLLFLFFIIALLIGPGYGVVEFTRIGSTNFMDDRDYISYTENILE